MKFQEQDAPNGWPSFHESSTYELWDTYVYNLNGNGTDGTISCSHLVRNYFCHNLQCYNYTWTGAFHNKRVENGFRELHPDTNPMDYLRPGDVVLWTWKDAAGKSHGHMGIWLGDNWMWHSSGKPGVAETNMWYWDHDPRTSIDRKKRFYRKVIWDPGEEGDF